LFSSPKIIKQKGAGTLVAGDYFGEETLLKNQNLYRNGHLSGRDDTLSLTRENTWHY